MNSLLHWGQMVADRVKQTVKNRMCNPVSTYRLQFSKDQMTFSGAAALIPYLDELGVSHLYASPYLKTQSGSSHGYAIVDYAQLDRQLGGQDEYRAMVDALQARNMGQIMDVVPNHMSAAPGENLWWSDVLENGPSSPYAPYFDIDWRPIKEQLRDKILLPVLGDQYGQVLESGDLKLEYRDGLLCIRYYWMELPLDPRTYRTILTRRFDELKKAMPTKGDGPIIDETKNGTLHEGEDLRELESIITALDHLPERNETAADRVTERQREKEVIKGRLRKLAESSAEIAAFIGQNVRELNGSPDNPHSFDELEKLLDAQVYRLSHWKAAADEINYRRFFDINELAAVCMEDPKVFRQSHQLMFDLLFRGDVAGLRIDHIDGLYDPMEYLWRLQRGYLAALGKKEFQQISETPISTPQVDIFADDIEEPPQWDSLEPVFIESAAAPASGEAVDCSRTYPLYVVVEKILGPEEPLPEQWPAAGTTGYDFLNSVNGLFVDRTGLLELIKIYERFADEKVNFRNVAYQSKLLILRTAMSSELQLLAHRINLISERNRKSRDFTLNTLRVAMREILACFPVYRTYIREGNVSERDRQFVCRAVAQAKRRNPAINSAAFDFIRDVLLLQLPPDLDDAGRSERALFVGRFQQVTSPVMAKAIEDTAFYRYFPLVSLNEVGGDPSRGVTAVEEFHRQNLSRQTMWPGSLISTTTHDTKRSEDVRARINVLSEIAPQWRKAVNRWARLNRRHIREVDGQPAPSRNDEYLFYQNLTGIWPLAEPDRETHQQLIERMQAYMEKATHEAKVHTSWINPFPEYDAAVREFVAAVLKPQAKNRFLSEFRRFHEKIVNWGLFTALSQTLLKLTSPGVPDIYQGQEIWDFSLVDPDNRRPVDFTLRRAMLAELKASVEAGDQSLLAMARKLVQNPRDPLMKLFVTWQTLQFRRRYADLFRLGKYIALEVTGTRAAHLCAFARQWTSPGYCPDPPEADGTIPFNAANNQIAIVIAPRLIAQLAPQVDESTPHPPPTGAAVWDDTRINVGDLGDCPNFRVNENGTVPFRLRNLFTGQEVLFQDSQITASSALADFPVAVLTNLDY
jgi:(1->4)-alpha-D-glucan 1-alpha-D-glucosylmutase